MLRRPLVLAAALAACAAAPPATTRGAPGAPGASEPARATVDAPRRLVTYALEIPAPTEQWVHVTMTVARAKGLRSQVAMPAWTPGSYLVRDHARHVDGLRAEDLQGRPLPVKQIDKQTWRVDHGLRGFRIRYRVFADEPGVRTSHVDDRHATLNGASIFLYLVGETARPARVELTLPAGWQAHSALDPAPAPAGNASFVAPDYHALVDAPFILGTPELRSFTVASTRVELVFAAPAGSNADTARIAADLQKIVRAFAELMGGLPLPRYVFMLVADDTGDGGLEHASSTLMRVPRDIFSDPTGYRRVSNLAAHEFFHLWNAKRLRDADLTPYDYRGEDYTRLLWFSEGFTETMEQQALLRAGLLAPDAYLKDLATGWSAYLRKPGRNHSPLVELSHDAWTKAYKPSPSHANTVISYYEKGHYLGLCLDLELRLRSASHGLQGSLPGLFRRLMASHGARGKGITQADIVAAASAEAGEAMDAFFARHVDATAELPLPELLARIGVRVTSEAGPRPYTGLVLDPERSVKNLEPGSPAAAAGLMLGDEVVAVAGLRVHTGDEAQLRLGDHPPGERVELALFRGGRLELRSLVLAVDPHRSFHFELAPDAALSPQTLGLRRAWLATPTP
ncbi:MAG: M61 family metallopeptidase [Nannocystis sp.]|uniref:M61 family metallopeptidase n=1 Tax=Nannocystis sp. TaxID=1962667 RepID=UPI0024228695|nr:PDZ domain-containing protein [Nannocystis sp.]MBK9758096.1 M61 family metallopeptidase [Nannocystis sp.]